MKYQIPFKIGDKVIAHVKVKKRVPCNICIEGQIPIFGEVFVCPKCKGKKKIDAFEEKDIETTIAQYNVSHNADDYTPRWGTRPNEALSYSYQINADDMRKKKVYQVLGVTLAEPHDPIELDVPFDPGQAVYSVQNPRRGVWNSVADTIDVIHIQMDTRQTIINYQLRANGYYYSQQVFADEESAKQYAQQQIDATVAANSRSR